MRLKETVSFVLGIVLVVFTSQMVKASEQKSIRSFKTSTIAQVKVDKNGDFIPDKIGDTVSVAGRVTVSSGVLMKDYLFIAIQDATAGIFIYKQNYKGPVIKQGDSIEVTGIVSQYAGLTELVSPHVNFLDTLNRKTPVPVEILHHSSEYYEGRLVTFKGIVIDMGRNNGGKYLIVSRTRGVDSTLEVFSERTSKYPDILNNFHVGETVQITGIFSQYDYSKPFDDGYQILPRTQNDVTVLEHNASYYLLIIGGITAIVLLSILLNFLLRRQVIKRTRELLRAKERAEESDRLKTAFLANMSHEIRTPMNGILGFTELLRESDLSVEEKDKYIEIIQQSGHRMLNTVNDIIEISKIETGLMSLNPVTFDINKVLEELTSFFQPEAKKKSIRLFIEKSISEKKATVTMDRHKYESILSNLIKNAIKYTNGGEIKTGYLSKKGKIEFYIIDTGMGISVERQKAVFDRFVQADIEDKKALGGSGLGLSIAKAYAEAIGGELWLERSVPGSGSEFRFRLPSDDARDYDWHRISKGLDKTEDSLNGLTVLVVEDDEVSYDYLTKLLTNIADEIFWAKDGLEAVEMVKNKTHIDVVLMDMLMPRMNGFEATKEIREFNKNIVIIAQTALALASEKAKILASGCDDYISKPVFLAGLKQVLSKYF